MLAFRTEQFVELTLVIAGIRAAWALVGELSARWERRDVERVAAVVGTALTFVLGQQYVDDLLANPYLDKAHATARPDGSLQPYAPRTATAPNVSAARMVELVRGMHRGSGPPVVLSTRDDFLKITPIYAFNQWQAIYAHPAGEFPARLEFTRHLARVRDPRRFAALARGNRFDSIDVFVLEAAAGGGLIYEVSTVKFPYGSDTTRVSFSREHFDSPMWHKTQAGRWFVAARR